MAYAFDNHSLIYTNLFGFGIFTYKAEGKDAVYQSGLTVTLKVRIMKLEVNFNKQSEVELVKPRSRVPGMHNKGKANPSHGIEHILPVNPMKPIIDIWDTIFNMEGRPIWTVPGMHKIIGYTDDEILNTPDILKIVVYKDDLPRVSQILHEALTKCTEGENLEFRCNHKNGTVPWVSVGWKQVYDHNGVRIGVRASGIDITQKKLANEHSRIARECYNILSNATSDTIWEWDILKDRMYYNDRIYTMFGYTCTEVDNIINWWQSHIHPDDIDRVSRQLQDVFSNRITQVEMEYRFLCADKSYKFILDRAFMVLNEKGEGIRLIGIMQDMTERKKDENELKKLVEVTTSQHARLRNFAYIVSHNIRSQSANINALVDCMEEAGDKQEKAELNTMLKKSIVKLEQTISDLNDIVTMQNEQKQRVPVRLHQEIEKIITALYSQIIKENSLVINQVPSDIILNVIPGYLESIVLQLITNAIQFRCVSRDPDIRLYAERLPDDMVCLCVEDNGTGMDMNKVGDKIFGMYKTFHNGNHTKGLGLFVCKNQAEAMGGRIEAESEPGKGSVFKVFLPMR